MHWRAAELFLGIFSVAAIFSRSVHACDTSNNPWTVQLPSSSAPINNDFTASISGVTRDREYFIDIKGNAGKVIRNNHTTQVIVRNQIPYDGSLVLYSLIGADADTIFMGWAYCTGEKLTSFYVENTGGILGFTNSTISGSCNVTKTSTSVDLKSSSQCISVTQPPAIPTIDGQQISLKSGSPGNVTLKDQEFNLIPFGIVDCSDCGKTYSQGWFEVHSAMTSKTTSDVCLGIFYLFLSCNGEVLLQYVQCFLGNATSKTFTAGYDLRNVLEDSTDAGNSTCEAATSPGSSSTGSGSGAEEVKIPVAMLSATLGIALAVIFSML